MPKHGPSIIPIIASMLIGTCPAWAGEAVGPCSPFRAADGDVPSEMPGCGRRARPVPGSLADEVEFARERRAGAGAGPENADEDAPPPRSRPRRR